MEKIGTNFNELLLSELRLVSFEDPSKELSEENLVKAMTVNEELINIGYSLAPKDIVLLSRSRSLENFFKRVKALLGDVKGKPLYPDFPTQVMELTEAQFRFHQILNYMSVYGIEELMGKEVQKGWVPYPDSPEKTKKDTRLLKAKTIALVPESEKYITALRKVTKKKERMTDKEILLVKAAVVKCPIEQLTGLVVPFKQNLFDIFFNIFESDIERDVKIVALRAICQHSGDAWKCIDYLLTRKRYHLRTSEKKVIVKLLESFSAKDFRANIILSIKKSERIKVLLPFISFDNLSRSIEHKAVIADLRDGKLHSWVADGLSLMKTDPDKAVEYFAKRPGELLRRVNHLLKSGCSEEKLKSALIEKSDKLSTQTIVETLNSYSDMLNKYTDFDPTEEYQEYNGEISDDFEYSDDYSVTAINIYKEEKEKLIKEYKEENEKRRAEFEERKQNTIRIIKRLNTIYDIFREILESRLASIKTGLEDKKVFLSLDNYNLDYSVLRFNSKSSEGGYMRSGLAYNLPGNVNRMRFFVYWNHPTRVDLDMHASAYDCMNNYVSIGWNSSYRAGDHDIIFSGDMTTSDSAEYVDFVTNGSVKTITANINIFYGPATFKEIEEVFVGVMAVDKFGKEVKLYSPENCFFSHYLTSKCRTINYGYIDVENKFIMFTGEESKSWYSSPFKAKPVFSLRTYLDLLISSKDIEIVDNPDEAEVILIMEKPTKENEISLIDNNFFAD